MKKTQLHSTKRKSLPKNKLPAPTNLSTGLDIAKGANKTVEPSLQPQRTFFSGQMIKQLVVILGVIFGLAAVWFRAGFAGVYLDTDLARDLSELSNIWQHKIVWLGPQLSIGFPVSPVYYYLFFPALKLAHGNAEALIVANLILASIALAAFLFLAWKKYGKSAVIATITVGLLPWWRSSAPHPGNGFTYVFWLFLALSCLWFELPLFIGSGLLGLATAYHPAAFFAVPLLLYEWWRRGHKLLNIPVIILSFAAAWSPLLAFEVITKGYLTRQWLAHPNTTGIHFQLGLSNLTQIASMLSLPLFVGGVVLVILFLIAKKRLKVWLAVTFLTLGFLASVSQLPPHYLLGALALCSFVGVVALLTKKWGAIFLVIGLSIAVTATLAQPLYIAPRSISKIENTVNTLIATGQLSPSQKIAVVAALSPKTEVPVADDYRFFLRTKGFNVPEVQNYNQADILLMFIETPNFAWQTWSNWEIEQSPHTKLLSVNKVNDITIVIWGK